MKLKLPAKTGRTEGYDGDKSMPIQRSATPDERQRELHQNEELSQSQQSSFNAEVLKAQQ